VQVKKIWGFLTPKQFVKIGIKLKGKKLGGKIFSKIKKKQVSGSGRNLFFKMRGFRGFKILKGIKKNYPQNGKLKRGPKKK